MGLVGKRGSVSRGSRKGEREKKGEGDMKKEERETYCRYEHILVGYRNRHVA
jgi:hypothetical protein